MGRSARLARRGALVCALGALSRARLADERSRRRPRRPVLLMLADDLRPQLGHLGFEDAETPHLDRLAAAGVSFRRAYCQAPSCNPSRSSFLTGLYPDVSKVYYFEGIPHLTAGARGEHDVFTHLRSHGFFTAGAGKLWHWRPVGRPFSRSAGAYFPAPGTYDQEWGCGDGDAGGRCSPTAGGPFVHGRVFPTDDREETLFDYRVATAALGTLARAARAWHRRHRPFFLGVGFHHPRPRSRSATST